MKICTIQSRHSRSVTVSKSCIKSCYECLHLQVAKIRTACSFDDAILGTPIYLCILLLYLNLRLLIQERL